VVGFKKYQNPEGVAEKGKPKRRIFSASSDLKKNFSIRAAILGFGHVHVCFATLPPRFFHEKP
jgi:hypothetical protein